jgi:hypothetical protein
MNMTEADNCITSGHWVEIIEDLAAAMRRYRDKGPVRKNSLLYDKWTERIHLLEDAVEI